MKRFWAYAGAVYYPTQAGEHDFVGAFENQAEAEAALPPKREEGWSQWWKVIEVTDDGPKTVAEGYWDDDDAEDDE